MKQKSSSNIESFLYYSAIVITLFVVGAYAYNLIINYL
jgi:hypothetical protein